MQGPDGMVSYSEAGPARRFLPTPHRPTILENEAMVAWDGVTRADVLRAIKEYDRLGAEQFFAKHGFAPHHDL
jgi:hypothetical protein